VPRNRSLKLVEESQAKLTMKLNNCKEVNFDFLNESSKVTLRESKQYFLSRDYRTATTRTRMSTIANDFIIGKTTMNNTDATKKGSDTF
jgi:hypothetical protein